MNSLARPVAESSLLLMHIFSVGVVTLIVADLAPVDWALVSVAIGVMIWSFTLHWGDPVRIGMLFVCMALGAGIGKLIDDATLALAGTLAGYWMYRSICVNARYADEGFNVTQQWRELLKH